MAMDIKAILLKRMAERGGGSDAPPEAASSGDDAGPDGDPLGDAMSDLMEAMKSGDVEAAKVAFTAGCRACEMAPDMEPPEEQG